MKYTFSVLVSLALLLSACSDSKTKLRFINAVPDSPEITITVENNTFAKNLAYQQATDFIEVSASTRVISIKQSSDGAELITFQADFNEKEPITLGLIGTKTSIQAVRLEEKDSTILADKARVRVWNLAPNLPQPSDVYFTNATEDDISTKTPNYKGLNFKTLTTFADFEPSSIRIRLTAEANKEAVADTGTLALEANQVSLLVVFDKAGGGTPVSLVRFNQ